MKKLLSLSLVLMVVFIYFSIGNISAFGEDPAPVPKIINAYEYITIQCYSDNGVMYCSTVSYENSTTEYERNFTLSKILNKYGRFGYKLISHVTENTSYKYIYIMERIRRD